MVRYQSNARWRGLLGAAERDSVDYELGGSIFSIVRGDGGVKVDYTNAESRREGQAGSFSGRAARYGII